MEESIVSDIKENIQNMKIFLHFIKPEFLPVGFVYQNIQNIDQLHDNQYEEIMINDSLDYVEYSESTNILDILRNKLQSNGAIIIQSTDLVSLANAISFNDLDNQTAKLVLYANHKKNIFTMNEIEIELKNRGFDVVEKKYINIFEYYIKAIKV